MAKGQNKDQKKQKQVTAQKRSNPLKIIRTEQLRELRMKRAHYEALKRRERGVKVARGTLRAIRREMWASVRKQVNVQVPTMTVDSAASIKAGKVVMTQKMVNMKVWSPTFAEFSSGKISAAWVEANNS